MNINLLRLKPVVRELAAIARELERMNDIREAELAYNGVHVRPPVADTSGPEPVALYTDEEADAIREIEEMAGRIGKQNPDV